ncbi:MAG: hypothetical protein Q8900_04125 [Bacillota bacterium]|nr:hypothetical protein [Bacillota bacterium]
MFGSSEGKRAVGSYFIYIAVFSIINTIIALFNGDISFVIGLGATQIVDVLCQALSKSLGATVIVIGVLINLFIAAIFIFFGYMVRKASKWIYIIGMIIYGFDGLIFLIDSDFKSIIFHGIFLFFMIREFKAISDAGYYNVGM